MALVSEDHSRCGGGPCWRDESWPLRKSHEARLLCRSNEFLKYRRGGRSRRLPDFMRTRWAKTRRRELMKEASRLLATARYPGDSWLRRSLPNGRRWTRAMKLISEADPDSLAPLEHQLRSSELRPATSIGSSSCSEESRQEIVNRVIDLRSSLMKSELSLQSLIPPVSSPADSCFTSRPKTCRMDHPTSVKPPALPGDKRSVTQLGA